MANQLQITREDFVPGVEFEINPGGDVKPYRLGISKKATTDDIVGLMWVWGNNPKWFKLIKKAGEV